jgi:LmbE family N-acetylglucosaminyl deacetylase
MPVISNSANVSLWFSPHQDDELLTMGTGIIKDVVEGKEVHVILCTDGRTSGVKNVLKNGQPCSICQGTTHSYTLNDEDFIDSRDAEFTDSCLALGVPASNIHIHGKGDGQKRAIDGALDAADAQAIIRRYLDGYPNATVATVAPLTGPEQHNDHRCLGEAAVSLRVEGKIGTLNLFVEPYLYPAVVDRLPETILRLSCPSIDAGAWARFSAAAGAYTRFSPESKRYAIGRHSMPAEFSELGSVSTGYWYRFVASSAGSAGGPAVL